MLSKTANPSAARNTATATALSSASQFYVPVPTYYNYWYARKHT